MSDSSALTIRPANVSDVPTILALVRDLAEFENLTHLLNASEENLREHLFGERPVAHALIAEWNGAAAGFALWFFNYSTFLTLPGIYLEDLFVRPAFRRNGIGRALLQSLARIAVERGCGRFEWSVLDWNSGAIAFYESLGARRIKEWQLMRVTGPALAEFAR